MPPLLEVKALRKSYSAPVLRDFDFELAAGEVHALVGSNGAGKSTFARILCGLTPADSGKMLLEGSYYMPADRRDAAETGVVMVLQELNIIPTLTVAENLFLDRLPARFGFIRYRELAARARPALARVGLADLDPSTVAGTLGVGRQQMVEIAAGLSRQCRVLILDEPTAALSNREVDNLFENIRELKATGVGIIYVTHRMDEIAVIADRITVMRDGTRAATHSTGAVRPAQLVREMAGHDLLNPAATTAITHDVVILEAREIKVAPNSSPLSFRARAGEIVGIAGLAGSGRSELLRALYDARARHSGEVRVAETKIRGGPDAAVKAGLGLIPEDRKTEGLLLSLSVRENTTLSTLKRYTRGPGWLVAGRESKATSLVAEDLDVRCASIEQEVSALSGGNQQKVLLGRWLLRDCAVLLLDEPTRGVDAAAKDQIHSLLRRLASEGKALVVVSSELEELMSLCHRILVLSAEELSGEFFPASWSREAITAAAFSAFARDKHRQPREAAP